MDGFMVTLAILFFGFLFFVGCAAAGTVRGLFNWVGGNERGKKNRTGRDDRQRR